MPILFDSSKGRVVRLNDSAAQAKINFYSMDEPITFDQQLSIVTRLTISQQVNVQFLHTLGAHVFIYVFGDRIGNISLSGLSFHGVCDRPGEYGSQKMLEWYGKNKSSKKRRPLQITIGNAPPLEGFVVGFSEDVVDPSTGLLQWNVNMVSLPLEI